MGGIKTVVKIPDLKGLVADGQKIAITEAKLIISNADANSIYSAPDNLVLFEEDTTGQVYFLSEQSIEPEYLEVYTILINKTTTSGFHDIFRISLMEFAIVLVI